MSQGESRENDRAFSNLGRCSSARRRLVDIEMSTSTAIAFSLQWTSAGTKMVFAGIRGEKALSYLSSYVSQFGEHGYPWRK
jgi:hypothetical protein